MKAVLIYDCALIDDLQQTVTTPSSPVLYISAYRLICETIDMFMPYIALSRTRSTCGIRIIPLKRLFRKESYPLPDLLAISAYGSFYQV